MSASGVRKPSKAMAGAKAKPGARSARPNKVRKGAKGVVLLSGATASRARVGSSGFHVSNHYVKVTFFRGTSLRPVPPGPSKTKETRYVDIREGELERRRSGCLGLGS